MQAILLYGSETRVVLASITKRIKGTNKEFLKMVTGKRAKQLGDGTWEMPGEEGIREAAGTKLDSIYIDKLQATVAQWVVLCPFFRCVKGMQGMK